MTCSGVLSELNVFALLLVVADASLTRMPKFGWATRARRESLLLKPFSHWQTWSVRCRHVGRYCVGVNSQDYLLPLKRLTNQKDTGPYIRALVRIQDWTSRLGYGQLRSQLKQQFSRCNAFQEDVKNYRLIFPEQSR
jgi:hypothetical protein